MSGSSSSSSSSSNGGGSSSGARVRVSPRNMLTLELAALAINLTWNNRNAELM